MSIREFNFPPFMAGFVVTPFALAFFAVVAVGLGLAREIMLNTADVILASLVVGLLVERFWSHP